MDNLIQNLSSYYNLPINKNIRQKIKIFKKLNSNDRKSVMTTHISLYLGKLSIEYLDGIKYSNILRAFLTYLLTGLQPDHDSNKDKRLVGYHRVYSELLNDDIDMVRSFCNNKYVVNGHTSTIYIVSESDKLTHVAFSSNSSVIEDITINNKYPLNEYLLIGRNNKVYFVTPESDIATQVLDGFNFDNGLNSKSYTIPIHNVDNLRNNSICGKDWIKEYMFRYTEGYIYFLELMVNNITTFKVGITKHSVEQRFKNLPSNITIINQASFKRNMLECAIIERYLHYTNYNIKDSIILEADFEGKTECYHNDILPQYTSSVLDTAINFLPEMGYPIPPESIRLILNSQNV